MKGGSNGGGHSVSNSPVRHLSGKETVLYGQPNRLVPISVNKVCQMISDLFRHALSRHEDLSSLKAKAKLHTNEQKERLCDDL